MKNDMGPTHKTIVICALLAAITALAVFGKDTAALISVGMVILVGIGISVATGQAVKEQTNGNMSRMLDIVEKNSQALTTLQQNKPSDLHIPPQRNSNEKKEGVL